MRDAISLLELCAGGNSEITPESVQKSVDIGPLYREIAEKHSVRFADATAGIEVAPDCEHLTEEGHRQIAKLFYEAITDRP